MHAAVQFIAAMMPKDCSSTAPDGMECSVCDKCSAVAVIRGWPVCGDGYCKYVCWVRKSVGPVKITADSTTEKEGD